MNSGRERFWKTMPIVSLILLVASMAVWLVVWMGFHTLPPAEYMRVDEKGADGVFRQVPPNCGLLAHVENHPKLGPLCIQNEGKWTTANSNTPQETPCVAGTTTTRDGKLLSCQDDMRWKQSH